MITVAFILAGWFGLAIFVRPLRWRWARTRIECGPVGSLAACLIFLSWGLRRLYRDSIPEFWFYILVGASILGYTVAIIGSVLARRRAKQAASTMQDLQRHMITRV